MATVSTLRRRSHKPRRAVLAQGVFPPARPPTCNRLGGYTHCGALSWPAGSCSRSQAWPLRQRPPPAPRHQRPETTTGTSTRSPRPQLDGARPRQRGRQLPTRPPHPAVRAETRHWLTVMNGRPPATSRARSRAPLSAGSPAPAALARPGAHRDTGVAAREASALPARWLCIHRYEGSWADSGSPYWGGLQMDLSFQQPVRRLAPPPQGHRGSLEPARADLGRGARRRVRGFSPWPNTARDCGLY